MPLPHPHFRSGPAITLILVQNIPRKSGIKCKVLLTFDDGKGPVVIVAELGQAEDLHVLPPPKNGKKKTPFQIHREERRKAEVEKVLTVKKN